MNYLILRRILLIGLSLYIQNNLISSQSITPFEYNAGGTEFYLDSIIYTASIGSFATTTFIKDTLFITQGYQQIEDEKLVALPVNVKVIVTAFPNPCTNYTNLRVSNLEKPVNCTITVFSSQGETSFIIEDYQFANDIPIRLSMGTFEAGLYIVRLTETNSAQLIGTVKILKLKN